MKKTFFHRSAAFAAKKPPRKRGGFTLVEVMVTLVITIIVIAVSSTLIITGTNIFARSAQRETQTNIAESVLTFVSDQLLYARRIEPGGPNTGNGKLDYGQAEGAILHVRAATGMGGTLQGATEGQLFFLRASDNSPEPVNVFGSGFYQNYKIGILLDIFYENPATLENASFTLTVNVYNSNNLNPNPVMSRTTTKPLLNYKGNEFEGLGGPGTYAGHFIDIIPPL